MSRPSYVDDTDYDRAVEALAHAGRMDPDEVMLILGEVGNIWPQSVLRDTIVDATVAVRPFKR